MIFLEEEYKSLVSTIETRAGDCGRQKGGKFGPKNDCASDSGGSPASDTWKSAESPLSLTKKELSDDSPLTGGDSLSSLDITSPQETLESMEALGVESLDDLVTLGGGVTRGASVSVLTSKKLTTVVSHVPINADDVNGPAAESMTSIYSRPTDDGGTERVIGFETLKTTGIDRTASSADVAKTSSLLMQKFVESMVKADELGFDLAETDAVGNADTRLQGYRLWPSFGFDGEVPDISDMPDALVEKVWRKTRPDLFATRVPAAAILKGLRAKGMKIQQLLAVPEGDRWWKENGSTVTLSFDFKDKSSLGYKKFKEKKTLLKKLRDRNSGRSFAEWIKDIVESRAFCATGIGNGVDNSCGSNENLAADKDSGGGGGRVAAIPAELQGPVTWSPGAQVSSTTQAAVASPVTLRSDDGKKIVSTTLGSREDGTIYEFPKGQEYVSTVEVGRHLTEQQAKERGGIIRTATKKLDSQAKEYIASSLVTQTQEAMSRGVRPAFYSPGERASQIEEFSRMIPQVRGGRMKDGTSIDQENAEHLFRALQAMTSPNATPFGNMQRTEALMRKFFVGDGRLTTSTKFGVTGGSIISGMRRYQAIIDTLGRRTDGSIDVNAGLAAARGLFQGKVMRVSDVEDFFGEIIDDPSMTWKPGAYLVTQEVPAFCTFGPKVGTFFANNNGELEHLTADVWWTRTWGRVTGELVVPASPANGIKHAEKLKKVIGKASADQLHGVDGDALLSAAQQMMQTGSIPDIVRAWSSARLRHYAGGDYTEKSGTAGRLNKVAKSIVENDVALMGDPGAGSRRANMITIARQAARQVGQPVAYMQDILWQDEQDAYAASGAKTATRAGVLSLYSDVIARIAETPASRLPMPAKAKKEKRSIDDYDPETYRDDYEVGGREQMLFESAMASITPERFAELAIKYAEKAYVPGQASSRAFCATGAGNGVKNDCSSSDKGTGDIPAGDKSLTSHEEFQPVGKTKNSDFIALPSEEAISSALNTSQREKVGAHRELPAGYPIDLRIDISAYEKHDTYVVTAHEHVGGVGVGTPIGYDSIIRLKGDVAFKVGETSATKIARGKTNKNTHSTVKGNFDPSRELPSDIDSWTPVGYNPKTAAYYYDKQTGQEVIGGVDSVSVGNTVFVRVPKYGNAKDPSAAPRNAKKNFRAFCPTGEQGGVDNTCGGDGNAARQSFPAGSRKFRDAIDSVASDSKAIWDRSKGLADTPPAKVLSDSADEQTSNAGKPLTPEAEKAYADLVGEIGRQYESLIASGLQVRAWRGEGEPYGDPPGSTKPNSNKMREEVAKTGEFSFFMTEKGFGSGEATPDHPMLRETKYKTADGEPMIANDLFRVVHDLVAHVRGGYSFSTNGEFNGMLTHASTLPESAWPALYAETFGQNAVYEKTGGFAQQNAYASKVGPEIIKGELAKRTKKSSRAVGDDADADEPLGYQHVKSRPWLIAEIGRTESRAGDCGRQEGGQFGPKNDCASEEGSTATSEAPSAAAAGHFGSQSNSEAKVDWAKGKGDEPFAGAGKYEAVGISAPKKIGETLDALQMTPSQVLEIAGAHAGGETVYMRPAPEYARETPFIGGGVTPIFVDFDREAAGVKNGINGSSVIGIKKSAITGESQVNVYYSMLAVSEAVRKDPVKRQAAAREFYRSMVAGVEAARKSGVAVIHLNAAGDKKDYYKGYTIWPRMGFDAPIPKDIAAKLPDDLSHAKTLLDLHATKEGTRWWADNGTDVDVSLDLRDKGSHQNQVFDRFSKRFSKDSRSMPSNATPSDGWLSPEDMAKIEEIWEEIWESDVLDDYSGEEQTFDGDT